MTSRSILFAQNFFRDRKLVRIIVRDSSIARSDLVYEIGPGKGILTKELAEVAGRVIAVEKDVSLAAALRSQFPDTGNVEIREGDFLRFEIKDQAFKVFSNIPFNITSDIMRKLLYAQHQPSDAYLVMQEEAAAKFSGTPRESEFSVLAKPWFDLAIARRFKRTDFEPVPAVDVVLLRATKRDRPLVSAENASTFRRLVKLGFEAWKLDLGKAYKKVFTYEQWKRMSRDLDFPQDVTPTRLTFEQWLGIFECFITIVPESKRVPFLRK